MGRCPKFLDVSGFDSLAGTMGIKLSDDGVSSLGEICEFLAKQILEGARNIAQNAPVDMAAVVDATRSLGIKLEIDSCGKTVTRAEI